MRNDLIACSTAVFLAGNDGETMNPMRDAWTLAWRSRCPL